MNKYKSRPRVNELVWEMYALRMRGRAVNDAIQAAAPQQQPVEIIDLTLAPDTPDRPEPPTRKYFKKQTSPKRLRLQ